MKREVMTFIGCDASYADANIVIFGAPFDATTSFRPGTRFASSAMRQESYGLETYSLRQDKDLSDCLIFDALDLELPFGNVEKALMMIEEMTSQILQDQKIPCMIGGEHLVTLGAFRAVVQKYPDVQVIHLDAHSDLRQAYLGETLSHACVIRRIHDIIGDHKIHQFGIRSGEREEFVFARNHTFLHPYSLDGLKTTIDALGDQPVYFTLDLDVLDPSVFPGTGTPEAGGISFHILEEHIPYLSKLNIVGFDVNELSPVYDQSGVSTAVANKILRELLLAIGGK